jgi:hypothetical protein
MFFQKLTEYNTKQLLPTHTTTNKNTIHKHTNKMTPQTPKKQQANTSNQNTPTLRKFGRKPTVSTVRINDLQFPVLKDQKKDHIHPKNPRSSTLQDGKKYQSLPTNKQYTTNYPYTI